MAAEKIIPFAVFQQAAGRIARKGAAVTVPTKEGHPHVAAIPVPTKTGQLEFDFTAAPTPPPAPAEDPAVVRLRQEIEAAAGDRDTAIAAIRKGLKEQTGRAWSVTGGRGTGWGWIHITAPPARRTFKTRPTGGRSEAEAIAAGGREQWEDYDCGEPGCGLSPADRATLKEIFGDSDPSVASATDYRRRYIALEITGGNDMGYTASPYWD